jgi:GH18 family chitinase
MISAYNIHGVYDAAAGINYVTYPSNSGMAWVSYDTTTTFQQKIDYANKKGLAGLFIWAVDQDDESLTALKGLTGKDLVSQVKKSDTLGAFNLDLCFITECGMPYTCPSGFSTMVSAISTVRRIF